MIRGLLLLIQVGLDELLYSVLAALGVSRIEDRIEQRKSELQKQAIGRNYYEST